MFKLIKYTLNLYIEQQTAQNRICALMPKKTKYIKIKIPKKYIEMIQTLAMYGINDNKELIELINSKQNDR